VLYHGSYTYDQYFNNYTSWDKSNIPVPSVAVHGDFYVVIASNPTSGGPARQTKIQSSRSSNQAASTGPTLWLSCDNGPPIYGRSYEADIVTNTVGYQITTYDFMIRAIGTPFDFRLSNSGSSSNLGGIAVTQGALESIRITGSLVNGPAQTVTLTCSGAAGALPTGVTCSFNPQSAFPPFTSTLTISTSTSTPVGFYTLKAMGTGGGVTRSTLFILEVAAPHSPLPPISPSLTSLRIAPVAFTSTGLRFTSLAERHWSVPLRNHDVVEEVN
jgi:hypothetical protein